MQGQPYALLLVLCSHTLNLSGIARRIRIVVIFVIVGLQYRIILYVKLCLSYDTRWHNPETTNLIWLCQENGANTTTKNYNLLETWRKEETKPSPENRERWNIQVSQEECARLREGVFYVKVYRYNPKHLCLKLNGYGDNGQRSLKLWQLLHTCWLPNTY